jgi:hypothetical protein
MRSSGNFMISQRFSHQKPDVLCFDLARAGFITPADFRDADHLNASAARRSLNTSPNSCGLMVLLCGTPEIEHLLRKSEHLPLIDN